MIVYVLNVDFSHEGESTRSVHSTHAGAVQRAHHSAGQYGMTLKEWAPGRWSEEAGVIPIYVIHEMELQE